MEALANAEKNAEQRIKEIQQAADEKLKQIQKETSNKNASSSSESLVELSDKLKKVENDLASKISDYNKELENNKRLSSEILSLKELHRSKIEELEKTIEVSCVKKIF